MADESAEVEYECVGMMATARLVIGELLDEQLCHGLMSNLLEAAIFPDVNFATMHTSNGSTVVLNPPFLADLRVSDICPTTCGEAGVGPCASCATTGTCAGPAAFGLGARGTVCQEAQRMDFAQCGAAYVASSGAQPPRSRVPAPVRQPPQSGASLSRRAALSSLLLAPTGLRTKQEGILRNKKLP